MKSHNARKVIVCSDYSTICYAMVGQSVTLWLDQARVASSSNRILNLGFDCWHCLKLDE